VASARFFGTYILIFEQSFWDALGLVETGTSTTALPEGGVSSSGEWAERAWKLFDQGQYSEAAWAFEKAGLPEDSANAHAYALQDQARFATDSKARIALYIQAAEALRSRCMADHNVASRDDLARSSARCWELAARHPQAASAYLDGKDYDSAIQQFLKLDDVEAAIRTARKFDGQSGLSSKVRDRAIYAGRIKYMQHQV
jgi:hypothetical protein